MGSLISRTTVALLAAASVGLSCPSATRAEGSGGSGGDTGTREGWPCDGCHVHVPARYAPGDPTPLLVAFHGDEGDPSSYIEWVMPEPTTAAGYILLALKCPRDQGCGGSWYRWADSGGYDPGWVERQVDAVEGEYDVERNRVYLAGFSGGSYFLAGYAPEHADRFAGVVYMGGGSGTWGLSCPSCPIPAYFLLGARDGRHVDAARMTESFLRDCGSEVEFETVSGVGHEIPESRLPAVFAWLDDRPHACRAPADPPDPPSAPEPDAGPDPGGETGVDRGPGEDGGTPSPGPSAPAADAGSPGSTPSGRRPRGSPPSELSGPCSAGSPASGTPWGWTVVAVLAGLGAARRRRRAPQAAERRPAK